MKIALIKARLRGKWVSLEALTPSRLGWMAWDGRNLSWKCLCSWWGFGTRRALRPFPTQTSSGSCDLWALLSQPWQLRDLGRFGHDSLHLQPPWLRRADPNPWGGAAPSQMLPRDLQGGQSHGVKAGPSESGHAKASQMFHIPAPRKGREELHRVQQYFFSIHSICFLHKSRLSSGAGRNRNQPEAAGGSAGTTTPAQP